MGPRVHLINPSEVSFGVAVITPRWLYVLAAATGSDWGDPILVDETLEPLDLDDSPGRRRRHRHSHGQCPARLRDRAAGARARRVGGLRRHSRHALSRRSARARRGARGRQGRRRHRLAAGRRATAWPAQPQRIYDGGRIGGDQLRAGALGSAARRTATCGRRCRRFAAVRSTARSARCGGPTARSRGSATSNRVVREIVELRRRGFRFIALADDNFYPVPLDDLAMARRRADPARLHELEALRNERFELMDALAELPDDMVFFTQITMEAAEDPEFLDAMRRAHIRGALVGVESVTRDGLEGRLQGLQPRPATNWSSDCARSASTACTCSARSSSACRAIAQTPSTRPSHLAERADLTFAQFVLLTPFPGTVDFEKWARQSRPTAADGRRHAHHAALADSAAQRPKFFMPHPTMSLEEIRTRTQGVWDKFYSWRNVWARAHVVESLRSRVAFVLISKLYRQMYANTGIATDSARVKRSNRWARWLLIPVRRLFVTKPMPELQMPGVRPSAVIEQTSA